MGHTRHQCHGCLPMVGPDAQGVMGENSSVYTDTASGGLPTGPAGLTTWLTRLHFVDVEGPSTKLLALEPLNGAVRLTAVGHFHKAKPPGTAGVTVGNDIDSVHGPIRFEELADIFISRIKRNIAYKDIHAEVL